MKKNIGKIFFLLILLVGLLSSCQPEDPVPTEGSGSLNGKDMIRPPY